MKAIEKLKNPDLLLDYVRTTFGQQGKRDGNLGDYVFKIGGENTASFRVYGKQNTNKLGYSDFSGRIKSGPSIIDFQMNYFNQTKAEAIKFLCDKFGFKDDEKKEFKKSPKRKELVENFEDYRMKCSCAGFNRFLQLRGVSFQFIDDNKEKINEVSQEFGFAENIWIKDQIYKDVIIFPCYNENNQIIGAKLRTTDGTPFDFKGNEIKSISVGKTGLIKKDLSDKYVVITEGEADYMILKLLGYSSVVGNLGGVSTHKEKIKKEVKEVDKIICCYDNDGPGIIGTNSLQEVIGRPIRTIIYPEIEGMNKYDLNDLFKIGYGKKEFDKLFNDSIILDELHKTNEQPLYDGRFFYNNEQLKYFDTISFSFKNPSDLARHLNIKLKELEELRVAGIVPTYEGVCYRHGGKNKHYNLLNEKKILKPSENPSIDKNIQFLITNLCNGDKENILWLLKAICYKYHNINDVFVPAVVFHGRGGTGKGLFIKLLEKIFGEENTLIGLTQDSIDSRFSAYSGQKLIVEFKEVSVEDTKKGKKNMNKLKSFIMEDRIQIEKKGQDPISTENIAWFIMSSNEAKPIHLDPSDSGNRRFTIIRTGNFIPKDIPNEKGISGKTIASAINNEETVKNFIARLDKKFLNEIGEISALENQDKRDLEFLSESVGNLFFQRFEQKFPNINKISNGERNYYLDLYRQEIDETEFNDDRYSARFFNNGLSPKYKISKPFIRGKQTRGYVIDKKVLGDGFFERDILKTKKD